MRECSVCNKTIFEGIVYDDCLAHYCSKKCLKNHFPDEEIEKLFDDDWVWLEDWYEEYEIFLEEQFQKNRI